MNQWVIQLHQN